MIKIIKEGKKEFIAKCPTCGCEFSYGAIDIGTSSVVVCPCCARYVAHKLDVFGEPFSVIGELALPSEVKQTSTADWHPLNVTITASDNDSRFDSLKTIHDLCVDYDGFNTVEGLKSLIDDIRGITEKNFAGKDRE
mgnify:CR=1 FL=1